jgi:hypothetical protein
VKPRLNYSKVAPGVYDAMDALDQYLAAHVPDALHAEARAVLSEKELADLTLAVATINAWNRLSIAARLVPGTYQPAVRG